MPNNPNDLVNESKLQQPQPEVPSSSEEAAHTIVVTLRVPRVVKYVSSERDGTQTVTELSILDHLL